MPKPFKISGKFHVCIPTFVNEHDEKVLSEAYSIILGCSALDDHKLDLFVFMLGGKDSVGAAAYLSLKTRGPKQVALNAAAAVVLSDEEKQFLLKIEKEIAKINKVRDELAHSVIVTPENYPEKALVLKNQETGNKDDEYLRVITLDEIFRWRNRIHNASTAIHAFSKLIGHPHEVPTLPDDKQLLGQVIDRALASQDTAYDPSQTLG